MVRVGIKYLEIIDIRRKFDIMAAIQKTFDSGDYKMGHKSISRREFIKQASGVGLGLTLPGLSSCEKESTSKRPNILFIFPDQLRAQALGYNGETNITTPHIDKLASEGLVFSNAISTCPICTPYRGMLQSGRYPTHSGIIINWVDPILKDVWLADLFHNGGYKTGFIGKWHLNAGYLRTIGKTQDGKQMHGEKNPGFNDPANTTEFVPPGPYRKGYEFWAAYNFHVNFKKNSYYYRDTAEKLYYRNYETDGEIDIAIEFMEDCREKNEPFFLMVAPHPPHNPWGSKDVPDGYMEKVKKDLDKRPNVKGDMVPTEHLKDGWDARAYFAMIKNVDDNVGRLMKYLKESGLDENTIVVFTADHGEMLGSQGRTYKMVPYAESVDVPLIFYWKNRIKAGRKSKSLYAPIDHMPTLLSLAGLKVPDFADGMDQSHVVLGRAGPERQDSLMMLYTSHWDFCETRAPWPEWRGVKTKKYSYVKWIDGSEELYDNISDPYQMTNLVSKEKSKDTLMQLRERLQALLKHADDDFRPGTDYIDWFDDERKIVRTALGPI